jgi:hypothetical protein
MKGTFGIEDLLRPYRAYCGKIASQGDALGWHVSAFQAGEKTAISGLHSSVTTIASHGVALGWHVSAFQACEQTTISGLHSSIATTASQGVALGWHVPAFQADDNRRCIGIAEPAQWQFQMAAPSKLHLIQHPVHHHSCDRHVEPNGKCPACELHVADQSIAYAQVGGDDRQRGHSGGQNCM